jgi:hypothetical protein
MLSQAYWDKWDERRAAYLRYKAERARRISEADKKQRREKAAKAEAAFILAPDLECDLGRRDIGEVREARTTAALQRLCKRFRARRDPEQQAALSGYLKWALEHLEAQPPEPTLPAKQILADALRATMPAPLPTTGWLHGRARTVTVERRKQTYFATPLGTVVRYRWSNGTYSLSPDESDQWEPPTLTAEQRRSAVRCFPAIRADPGPPPRSPSDDAILEASW